jgi:hypothetical protein
MAYLALRESCAGIMLPRAYTDCIPIRIGWWS